MVEDVFAVGKAAGKMVVEDKVVVDEVVVDYVAVDKVVGSMVVADLYTYIHSYMWY